MDTQHYLCIVDIKLHLIASKVKSSQKTAWISSSVVCKTAKQINCLNVVITYKRL